MFFLSFSYCLPVSGEIKLYIFNQSLLDFFNLVDLRLILMPVRESLKITRVRFVAVLLREYDTIRYEMLSQHNLPHGTKN